MDKELLIRILGANNRIVIPTFGAFLRKQQGEALVFSPFLKSDDGFLSSVVSEEYGVSDDDARQMVAAFAEHIASVLRARSKYYIDGVGTLVIDDNGAVTFVMDTTRQIPSSHQSSTPPVQEFSQPQPQSQPQSQTQAQPQPINSRPVAPQPISAARPVFTPPTPIQPQPAPTPVRPVVQPRPTAPGGFTRPTPVAAPIAQPQPMQPAHPQATQPPQAHPQSTPSASPNGAMPNGERPMNRTAVGAGSNMQRRHPAARRKGKNDVWLVVAIIAALVVIILMVIGILTANEMGNLKI